MGRGGGGWREVAPQSLLASQSTRNNMQGILETLAPKSALWVKDEETAPVNLMCRTEGRTHLQMECREVIRTSSGGNGSNSRLLETV